MNKEKNKSSWKDDKPVTKPDPATLETTDPQDHMEGPLSSIVQSVTEKAEEPENGKEENDQVNKHKE